MECTAMEWSHILGKTAIGRVRLRFLCMNARSHIRQRVSQHSVKQWERNWETGKSFGIRSMSYSLTKTLHCFPSCPRHSTSLTPASFSHPPTPILFTHLTPFKQINKEFDILVLSKQSSNESLKHSVIHYSVTHWAKVLAICTNRLHSR